MIRKTALFILLFPSLIFAQRQNPVEFSKLISEAGLKKDLYIIASAEMEGRETGTEGQNRAADYIVRRFTESGLEAPPSTGNYLMDYVLITDSAISSKLSVGKTAGRADSDYLMPAGPNASGQYSSEELVFAGYGIRDEAYDDYEGISVKGKTVVIVTGEPRQQDKYLITQSEKPGEWTTGGIEKKLALAYEMGAAGALVLNPEQETFSKQFIANSKRQGVFFPDAQKNRKLNYCIISHGFFKNIFPDEAVALIAKAKTSAMFSTEDKISKPLEVSMEYSEALSELHGVNVIGMIEGTDLKNEYLVLTAHFDHLGKKGDKIYYGADDDGSGTVAVLQMADAFARASAAGNGPRRTVVFMTVSGEEKGLWGSRYYSDHPAFPLESTTANLNTDMIGRIDTERKKSDTLNYIYVIGHDKVSSQLGKVQAQINKEYTQLVLDYKFDDPKDPNRIFYRSDHYNFARKGVPILFFYDGMLQGDYHKPTDTVDKINWPLYLKRTRMIFLTAWELANRDGMMIRDLPLPEGSR